MSFVYASDNTEDAQQDKKIALDLHPPKKSKHIISMPTCRNMLTYSSYKLALGLPAGSNTSF